MNATQAVRFFLAQDKIVQCASPEQKSRLIASAILEKYDFDAEVYSQNSETNYVYYVISGVVNLFLPEEEVPKAATKGSYFGQEAAINAESYAAKAIVKEPALILKFPKYAIEGIFLNNTTSEKNFTFNFFTMLSGIPLSVSEGINRGKEENKKSQKQTSFEIAGWILAILLPLGAYFFLENLIPPHSSRLFISLLSVAFCMWVFELVSSYIPGIFLVVSVLSLGIAPTEKIGRAHV